MEHLRVETSAHVYRIIQEALTNASKHADARHVQVKLCQSDDAEGEKIRLSVFDDGIGSKPADKASPLSGAGLIGMRERVLALSGTFDAGPLPRGGFGLRVEFPTLQQGG
jgi:signal transduction histidine kinase